MSAQGCESATRLAVTATVNALPAAPTNASENSVCGSGEVAFKADAADGCTVKWYDAATGGNLVSEDNPYTENLSATKTYYAASVSAKGCESATRTAVTGTVNTLPNTPTDATATPAVIGPDGSSALSATVGNGEEVVWYAGSCDGTPVTSPVSPTQTTTYYAKAKNSTTDCLSESCAQVTVVYDDSAPVLEDVSVTDSETGGAPDYNFLKGIVSIEANATDDVAIDKVEYQIDSKTPIAMTLDEQSGKYVASFELDADWENGEHSITIIATDTAGNEAQETVDFTVNINEVSGYVACQEAEADFEREVTFVLNGTDSRTVSLEFETGRATYSFTDVDEITSISAKTQWNLRTKMYPTSDNGQFVANFTGAYELRGGDLAIPGKPMGDNVVNALDYAVLRTSWGYGSAGDITGDGFTDNNDYLVMFWNWYAVGDAP